jgi:hypothetical protein
MSWSARRRAVGGGHERPDAYRVLAFWPRGLSPGKRRATCTVAVGRWPGIYSIENFQLPNLHQLEKHKNDTSYTSYFLKFCKVVD